MKLTFLYIEDVEMMMRDFKELVDGYLQQKNIQIHWKTYTSIPEFIDFSNIDACFLDVEVNDKNSLDFLRNYHIDIPVVIVSQYPFYNYEASHLHIFDFVNKQDDDFICQCLDELIYYLENKERIIEKGNNVLYMFYPKDICYIEIEGHQLIIHKTNDETIELWKKYDDMFDEYSSLLRVHRSFAINLQHCASIDKEGAHMKNGQLVKVSRRYYKNIMKNYRSLVKA